MIRRSFLKRMALAAAACAFLDVPWPKERTATRADPFRELRALVHDVFVREVVPAVRHPSPWAQTLALAEAEQAERNRRWAVALERMSP